MRALVTRRVLDAWVSEARDAGLIVALAGQLTADDLPFARDAGAEIAGVRGAACDGGRTGRVSADKVRMLRAVCESLDGAAGEPVKKTTFNAETADTAERNPKDSLRTLR